MFNVGILTSLPQSPVFLISGVISPAAGLSELGLNTNGTTVGSNLAANDYGWYRGSPISGIGSSYESRGILEVGQGLGVAFSGSINNWRQITSQARYFFDSADDAYGRVRIEIRDRATQQVLAIGRYWTHSNYAP